MMQPLLWRWIGIGLTAVALTGCQRPTNVPKKHPTLAVDERASLFAIENSLGSFPARRGHAIVIARIFATANTDPTTNFDYQAFRAFEIDARTPEGTQKIAVMEINGLIWIALGDSAFARAQRAGLHAAQDVLLREIAPHDRADALGRLEMENKWWASAGPFFVRNYNSRFVEEGRLQTFGVTTVYPFVVRADGERGTGLVLPGQIGVMMTKSTEFTFRYTGPLGVFLPPTAEVGINNPANFGGYTQSVTPPRLWSTWWVDIRNLQIDELAQYGEKAIEQYPALLAKATGGNEAAATSAPATVTPAPSFLNSLAPAPVAPKPAPVPGTGWLGIGLGPLQGPPIVTQVNPGGPAAGSLMPGDLIISLGLASNLPGTTFIRTAGDVIQFIRGAGAGQRLEVTARRGTATVRYSIPLGNRPPT